MLFLFLFIFIINLLVSIIISFIAINRKVSFYKVFFISACLSFIVGLTYLNLKSTPQNIYYSKRFKCPRCEYQFTEESVYCPLCKVDGNDVELHSVTATMT